MNNRLSILFILAVTLIIGCSEPKPLDQKILGNWKGQDAVGHAIELRFGIGGVALSQDDRTVTGTWELDASKEPAQLTLTLHTPAGTLQTVPMIVDFPTSRKMKLRIAADFKNRPTAFVDGSSPDQIILKRTQ